MNSVIRSNSILFGKKVFFSHKNKKKLQSQNLRSQSPNFGWALLRKTLFEDCKTLLDTAGKDTTVLLKLVSDPLFTAKSWIAHYIEISELARLVKAEDLAVSKISISSLRGSYPGVVAIASHRRARYFWERGHYDRAYQICMRAKAKTGMEIHPGATIGKCVIADHCEALIVGETAVIGDGSVLHHEVTIGATGKPEDICQETQIRHASLGKRVIVGFGCKLFGAIKVEDNCSIGAGSMFWGGPTMVIGSGFKSGAKNLVRKTSFGTNCRIGSACVVLGSDKGISIGTNVSIRNGVFISGSGITIGENVQIADGVRILGDNFRIPDNTQISLGATVEADGKGGYTIASTSNHSQIAEQAAELFRVECESCEQREAATF